MRFKTFMEAQTPDSPAFKRESSNVTEATRGLNVEDRIAVVKNIRVGTKCKYFDKNQNVHQIHTFGAGKSEYIGKRIKVGQSSNYIPMWYTYIYDGTYKLYFHPDWLSFYEEGQPISLFPSD